MCDSVNECYGAMSYLNRDISSNIGEVKTKFQLFQKGNGPVEPLEAVKPDKAQIPKENSAHPIKNIK